MFRAQIAAWCLHKRLRQTWIRVYTVDSFRACKNNVFGNQRPFCRDQAVLSQTYSPHTCPSVRCCSGWVRERLCLLWRWSESCGIPASSPTLRKEPLHRCSPKVNEAPWFCGSSVFWNEVLFCPGMNFFESLNFSPILLIHKCCLI